MTIPTHIHNYPHCRGHVLHAQFQCPGGLGPGESIWHRVASFWSAPNTAKNRMNIRKFPVWSKGGRLVVGGAAYVFNDHFTLFGGVFNFGRMLNHDDSAAVGLKIKYEF